MSLENLKHIFKVHGTKTGIPQVSAKTNLSTFQTPKTNTFTQPPFSKLTQTTNTFTQPPFDKTTQTTDGFKQPPFNKTTQTTDGFKQPPFDKTTQTTDIFKQPPFDKSVPVYGSLRITHLIDAVKSKNKERLHNFTTPIYESLTNTNLLNFTTETNDFSEFPLNYTPQNTITNGEFISLNGYGSDKHGWFSLYDSNHTSKNIDYPSPRSNNPFQPFQYGNPNIQTALNIKNNLNTYRRFSPDRGDEPYIVTDIGDRRKNKGYRIFPFGRAKTDFKRIGRYLKSPAGLLELALKNANLFIKSSVVRNGDNLRKYPQRFNNGFNPFATLFATGGRFFGQGLPNVLIQSGFSRGYTEPGGFLDFPGIKGDEPEFKLNSSFTGASKDIDGETIDSESAGFWNFRGIVEKTSTGDKVTLGQIIKGTSLEVTTVGKTKSIDGDSKTIEANIDDKENGMPLYFKDLRDNAYIFFRAYLEGITEDISPSWSEHNYIGRSEPVYVYERATRTINFTLKLAAQTENELTAIYTKLNRLTSLCYPEYAKDVRLGDKLRMKPPLTKFRMGDMFGKTNQELLGFIETLSYQVPEESTWETKVGKRVPKYISATITYKVIHGEVPGLYKGNKDSSDATSADEYSYYGI